MESVFSKCNLAIEYANKTKTFGCFYSEKNDPNENIHLHECFEILFCLSGGKTFFIDDRIYSVDDGDIFVLNQFEAHKITADDDKAFKRCVMQIHPAFIYEISTHETDLANCFNIRGNNIWHKLPTTTEEREKMLHIFRKMTIDYNYGDDILKNIAAIEFITHVNNLFSEKNKGYTYHMNYETQSIVTAIKYINENFDRDVSLENVAKVCYISVNQLCRLFRKHMGTTVAKYVASRRITAAKKLLKEGCKVSDIAEKCGFLDYTSFIRAFKNTVGMPPGQYKKTMNIDKNRDTIN
jgi:AraC-like DNA-binding protein